MQQTAVHTRKLLKRDLALKNSTYTTELSTRITRNDKTTFTNIAEKFTITYIKTIDNLHVFKKQAHQRFFLNEINFIIKKLNKAQKLALKVAAINDDLEFHLNEDLQLVKVGNTDEIRKKWNKLKLEILEIHPDLTKMVDDFDVQLEDKYIQKAYLEDNYLIHLFSNIFHEKIDENKAIIKAKSITNAMGEISIPIIEKITPIKNDSLFSKTINVETTATLDQESKKFPLAKLNNFIGELTSEIGSKHQLNFDYKGNYTILKERSLVSQATLIYTFEVGKLYKKISTFNFKLEENE